MKQAEESLYPFIEKWMKRRFSCFRTDTNRGLKHSRIDVVGVRDVGGDLSGEIETISIEVKRGEEPFATACGQALGYKIYTNRVYLSDIRERSFSRDEISIAGHLGVGLVRVSKDGKSCEEVVSSPYYTPIVALNLRLLEVLSLGRCQVCGSFFEIGGIEPSKRFSNLSRENLKNAIRKERGFMFWNREVADRKAKLGIRVSEDDSTFERRFVCPDCIEYFISQLTST